MSDRPSEAELQAAGLYDPQAPDAAARLALIEYLLETGATLDDLAAVGPNELPLVVTNLRLWGDRDRFTFEEAATMSRMDDALLRRFWRAAGFPEPEGEGRVLTHRDLEIFGVLSAGIEFLGEDVILQTVRVIGAAAGRVAEAAVSVFVANVLPSAIEADPSGLEVARANELSIVMLDGLSLAFDVLLRHGIERGFRPLDEGAFQVAGVDVVERSIGFADLVDSTSWTQEQNVRDLARALNEFDATASEVVVAGGGRLVKMIGDEVMFVANDPASAANTALDLVDAFASHPMLPPVRVGVATGAVVARDGDYSGPVVNLAARAVKMAAPSSVLVDDATRAALDESFVRADAGRSQLKGFAEPVPLFRISRNA